jgi:hypothetical protein
MNGTRLTLGICHEIGKPHIDMMIYRDNLRNVQGQVADYVDEVLDEAPPIKAGTKKETGESAEGSNR